MAYKAIMNIGDYKKGEFVPDEKAEEWNSMYVVKPCEKVSDVPKLIVQPKVEVVEKLNVLEVKDKSTFKKRGKSK